jgi:dihydropyrimidinase
MDLDPGTYDITDGEVNMTDEFLVSIINEAAKVDSTVLLHAENPVVCSERISKRKVQEIQNGIATTAKLKIWCDCRPPSSEAESIIKVTGFASNVCSKLYFVHIGSTLALNTILAEKQKRLSSLYIETCPHYLTHTADFDNIIGKVVPPLRSKRDIQNIWLALQNGHIDTIGTDHVANRLSMKIGHGDLWTALAGFPGIATMLPVLLSKGVNEDRISIERVSEVTSYNTAKIFGMYPKKGTIQQGSDADLIIVDLDLEQKVTPEILQSYSDYTIYDGWRMRGWPVLTMVRGEVIMQDGLVNNDTLGHGAFVARPTPTDDKLYEQLQ